MANYNSYIYDVFGNRISDDFRELVDDILDRFGFDELLDGEEHDLYEMLVEDIDSSYFIYDTYQWAMMEHYQNPQDANFDEAYDLFAQDMMTLIGIIADDMASEEE